MTGSVWTIAIWGWTDLEQDLYLSGLSFRKDSIPCPILTPVTPPGGEVVMEVAYSSIHRQMGIPGGIGPCGSYFSYNSKYRPVEHESSNLTSSIITSLEDRRYSVFELYLAAAFNRDSSCNATSVSCFKLDVEAATFAAPALQQASSLKLKLSLW